MLYLLSYLSLPSATHLCELREFQTHVSAFSASKSNGTLQKWTREASYEIINAVWENSKKLDTMFSWQNKIKQKSNMKLN